ncbi:hypothetical protein [Deinococcus wulumuqiensis]|uniref:hypothetical protein n=1 Tax=Deinococcus wulumuqiensis TaxID=980427 RepID=UPI00126789D2|nr:hypothetical protein [Deinococcus wulumuqiensis]QII22329.1 hypothetical protein G6R31_15860 [Deinococcus wulumuqiensis R12]
MNWTTFESLPGAADQNFEMLCRAIIRRQFEDYGRFRALANQPGIEFDLRVEKSGGLGEPQDWFGWQCRWYDLPPGRSLGTTRRRKIVEAIDTTKQHFPGLTHWVLWTRHPLTAGDRAWFDGITTHMQLLSWTAAEIDEYLNGQAAILRETYFGELILTPGLLHELHGRALAPVQKRWQPEVHQMVNAERALRAALADPESWDKISEVLAHLAKEIAFLKANRHNAPPAYTTQVEQFITEASQVAASAEAVVSLLREGTLDALRDLLPTQVSPFSGPSRVLPRRLRAARSPLGLEVTDALAHADQLLDHFTGLGRHLKIRMVGIVGEAGMGKTELAVALSLPQGKHPAGVLLHGNNLAARGSLDDLASRVVIAGRQCPNMEALVAALDAAALRSGCRLPLVIDGLNEAEDPRLWRAGLASLSETLRSYPRVLVVCTVRPAFEEEALPDQLPKLTLKGFQDDLRSAMHLYFEHYRIEPGEATFHRDLINHPLTLRLYCEVTNPERRDTVRAESMPRTLSALFERYFDQVAQRIAELSSSARRMHAEDIHGALRTIGRILWDSGRRSIGKEALRTHLDPPHIGWHFSMVRLLEDNGVLLTGAGHGEHDGPQITLLYDLMAGHVIAEALILGQSAKTFANWFRQPETADLFFSKDRTHPLASDVFKALITLLPRRFRGTQVWQLVDEPLRRRALLGTMGLEAGLLDQETVLALADLLKAEPGLLRGHLKFLKESRTLTEHPLNAHFAHRVLDALSVSERDLSWSEWIRGEQEETLRWIAATEQRWREAEPLDEVDDLKAQWMSWLLTSTVQRLRDFATRALHWYGQKRPAPFVELVTQMVEVNDPYVVERILAAALAAVLPFRHVSSDHPVIREHLPTLGRVVYDRFFAPGAAAATTHIMTLDYARRIVAFLLERHPDVLAEERRRAHPPFPEDLKREWGVSEDLDEGRYKEGDSPLGFDWHNYTLGRLVPGRAPYDDDHGDYQLVRSQVLWRIYDLGYTLQAFSSVDREIARRNYGREEDRGKTERYGKKYAWIAFYELAGKRFEAGQLEEHTVEDFASLDPSFPGPPRPVTFAGPSLLGPDQGNTVEWLLSPSAPDLGPWLIRGEIDGAPGPWLLLDGELRQEDQNAGRMIKTFIRTLLVEPSRVNELRELCADPRAKLNWFPEPPSLAGTYAAHLPPEVPAVIELDFHVNEGKQLVEEEVGWFLRDGEEIGMAEVRELISIGEGAAAKRKTEQGQKRAWERAILKEMEQRHLTFGPVTRRQEREVIRRCPVGVLSPVASGSWPEGRSAANPAWRATVPARLLTAFHRWHPRPKSFDFEDVSGRLQAMYLESQQGSFWTNWQNFTYARADAVVELAKAKNLSVIWFVHGERSRSTDAFQSNWRTRDKGEVYYNGYREIAILDHIP